MTRYNFDTMTRAELSDYDQRCKSKTCDCGRPNPSFKPECEACQLKLDAYLDDEGVYRWISNDQVPFDDLLEAAGVAPETRQTCREAREAGYAALTKRLKAQDAAPDAEQLFEMRAAFGEGTTVVNVITGRRTKL